MVNLVTNIGFRTDATHTTQIESQVANLESYALNFPLIHPKTLSPNLIADKRTFNIHVNPKENIMRQLFYKMKELAPTNLKKNLKKLLKK